MAKGDRLLLALAVMGFFMMMGAFVIAQNINDFERACAIHQPKEIGDASSE